MSILFLIMFISMFTISMYLILYPQDAYSRFNISFKSQIKILIGIFIIYSIAELIKIIDSVMIGVFPPIAIFMLIIDIFVIKHYIKQIN